MTQFLGPDHPRWKGGRRVDRMGYVWLLEANHPYNVKGYVMEHRLVMEKHIGRFLNKHESVHHRNRIRNDNRLENLEIIEKGEHIRRHMIGNKYSVGVKPSKYTRSKLSKFQKKMVLNRARDEFGRFI